MKKINAFLVIVVLECTLLLIPALPAKVAVAQVSTQPPNILFILVDDMGWGDLGCYGQQLIQTPNLNRMATEGAKLTSAYAACPVCAPSRAGLLLGYHMGHSYIRTNPGPPQDTPLRPQDFTVAEMLQSTGYHTGMSGKWHLGYIGSTGDPEHKGFDEALTYNSEEGEYYPSFMYDNGQKVSVQGYLDDLCTANTLRFMAEAPQPWFHYLALTAPHAPYVKVPKDSQSYRDQPWSLPDRNYAAMTSRIDAQVGQILRSVPENTVVFFSSDNGPEDPDTRFQSAGPFSGFKRDLNEGGVRMPFLVWWPGHVKSQVIETPVALYDFMATASELAGVDAPAGDGISMLSVLFQEEVQKQHEFLYFEFRTQKNTNLLSQAVRMGNWKSIRVVARKKGQLIERSFELYDLSNDLAESNDLSAQFPEVVERIRAIMVREHTPPDL